MTGTENQYWPFDVLPPDRRTEAHEATIRFLDAAHREGYRPYRFGSDNYGATLGARSGEIINRGRRGERWEVNLATPEGAGLSAHLDDFGEAARALLLWLGGAGPSEVFDQIRGHLIEGTKPMHVATVANPGGLA